MNDKIGFEEWEFQIDSETAELRRLRRFVDEGTERARGIDAQIAVLDRRARPVGEELSVYARDPVAYESALGAARWAHDTKDVYPPPSAAWREALGLQYLS